MKSLLKVASVFVLVLSACSRPSASSSVNVSSATQKGDRVTELLRELMAQESREADGTIRVEGPSANTQRSVPAQIIAIAAESREARVATIGTLISILEKSESQDMSMINHRWLTAVQVLGELKAEEAVDVLVRNIKERGTNGVVISLHFRPVASALLKIGEPAIPSLIRALSNDDPVAQEEAAGVLSNIGKPAVPRLYDALYGDNPSLKGGAALALGWIGGRKVKLAIQYAIEIETNDRTKHDLKDAFKEMRRYWGEN